MTTTWGTVITGTGRYAAQISNITISQIHVTLGDAGFDVMRFTLTAPQAAIDSNCVSYVLESEWNYSLSTAAVVAGTFPSPSLICGWMRWPPNWGALENMNLRVFPDWGFGTVPSDADPFGADRSRILDIATTMAHVTCPKLTATPPSGPPPLTTTLRRVAEPS